MELKMQHKYMAIFCVDLSCCLVLRTFNVLTFNGLNISATFFLWGRLRRSTIRRNLEMVLAELMCRTAVWKVLVLRWSVFRGLSGVSQRFPDVLWEFQKSVGRQRRGKNN